MPSGRYLYEASPHGRLAAAAAEIVTAVKTRSPHGQADYADFLESLQPYVEKELILAKLDEARLFKNEKRVTELGKELDRVNRVIAKARA